MGRPFYNPDTTSIRAPAGQGCPRCGGAVFAAEQQLAKGTVSSLFLQIKPLVNYIYTKQILHSILDTSVCYLPNVDFHLRLSPMTSMNWNSLPASVFPHTYIICKHSKPGAQTPTPPPFRLINILFSSVIRGSFEIHRG